MFLAALSLIVKTWKQLRGPSEGEWINKHPYSGILSSDKKKQDTDKKTGKNLKCTLLRRRHQSKKTTIWFQLCDILEEVKLYRQQEDQWFPEAGGRVG